MKNGLIEVQGREIGLLSVSGEDYISLTDIARYRNSNEPFAVINNWIRNRSTIEFIGLWERLHNKDFKPLEFERFKIDSGTNYFVLSPQKWIETTNAKGIVSRSGRYGGTFAHKDIAFEFATWISSEFKLYLITEFQRLKEIETDHLKLEWNVQRTISKINYRIHTDAIKENLIPSELSKRQIQFVYANEATLEQLVVLSNLESINSVLIHQNLGQSERLLQLNRIAISQMKSLVMSKGMKKLKGK